MLPAAREDLNPQLVFKKANLLADPRLGSEERLRSGGHVQIVVCDFPDIAKLLKFHRRPLLDLFDLLGAFHITKRDGSVQGDGEAS
jgi:hypothetical protein